MSDAVIEFQHTFTEQFLKDGMKRDVVWRLHAAAGAALVGMGAVAWLLGHPPWTPTMGIALAAGAFATVLIVPRKFRQLVRRAFALWEQQAPDHVVTYRLDHEAIEVITRNSRARHAWRSMRRLWRYDDVWLIEVVKMQSVLFPSDAPEAARAFVVARFEEAGLRT